MQKIKAMSFFLVMAISVTSLSSSMAQRVIQLSEADAVKLGTQAYIYAYPLVTMDLTRRIMTNVQRPTGTKSPMGQFIHTRTYPTADDNIVTTPSVDTLYSTAWVNLAKEPYILHVPEEEGRYYLMPMFSAWTDIMSDPGMRTTGTKAHDLFIVGPNWQGDAPQGTIKVASTTNMVWIIGRTYCTGSPADYQTVHDIQDQYTLTPYSAYADRKSYTAPVVEVDTSLNMDTPVRTQVQKMDAETFFSYFARLLKDNPPTSSDAPIVVILAKLGIVSGKAFDMSQLDPAAQRGLNQAVSKGIEKIMDHANDSGVKHNGWLYSLQTGGYGTDYLQRAFVAAIGLGANLPVDSIYPMTSVDSNGQTLSGINHYVLHFDKGMLPPVNGFWSLSMYNDQLYFVENPLNRYMLSLRDNVQYNPDGSLDLYIQRESPGRDKESNWLPAPANKFVLMLRFYWPKNNMVDGTWVPPAVQKQATNAPNVTG